MKSHAVRRVVLDTGWTVEKAEHEYQIALNILSSLGEANVSLGDDQDGFDIEIVVGN
jgi:phage gp36-like protein